jgi:glutamine amidotransferase
VITIVDYQMGNPGSIQNMLMRIGAESVLTSDPAAIASAERLILPGVGAFDTAMTNLRALGLVAALNAAVLERRVPILGICLGMQLFGRGSDEGRLPGLGWIAARTVRFQFPEGQTPLRIPHMGWNQIRVWRTDPLLDNLPDNSRFYFVHSYHVRCDDETSVLATTDYGITFHSAVARDHIVGTQFHPEKSHKFGMRVLRNFAGAGP